MAKRKTGDESKMDKPLPGCKAILLCDQIIVEAGTGKISVIGTFDRLYLATLPGYSTWLSLFLQLVDGIGSYALAVEIHHLTENLVLARVDQGEVQFQERPVRLNLEILIPPLSLEHPGAYDVVVLANEQEIDRQQLQVVQLPDEVEEQADGPEEAPQ